MKLSIFVWSLLAALTSRSLGAHAQSISPPNDRCVNATLIVIGDVGSGSTSNIVADLQHATPDPLDAPIACGAQEELFFGQNRHAAPGLWYQFVSSTGGRVHFESISGPQFNDAYIYTGSACGLDALQCVARFRVGSFTNPFTFMAESGVLYRLLVTGTQDFAVVNISASRVAPKTPVDNDDCINAQRLTVNTTIAGSATFATPDNLFVTDNCVRGSVSSYDAGLWYSFNGTGDKLTLASSIFSGEVAIYQADGNGDTDSCSSLSCVAGSGVDNDPQVTFYTELGRSYRALLLGVKHNENFTMSLSRTANSTSTNDLCTKALPITLGVPLTTGNLSQAAYALGYPWSKGAPYPGLWYSFVGPGLWYSLTGTGDRVTVQVASCDANTADRITLYTTGSMSMSSSLSCASLQFVAAFEVPSCDGTPYTFSTQTGGNYFLLLQGNRQQGVNLTFVPTSSVNDNDSCNTATTMSVDGPVLRNNNVTLATQEVEKLVPDTCPCRYVTDFNRGLWYTFQGTGGVVWVDVCASGIGNSATIDDAASLAVYQGSSCGPTSLQCVHAAVDGASTCGSAAQKPLFDTVAGATYYLLVGYRSSPSSNFDLQLKTVPAPSLPPNDACSNAVLVTVGSTISGDLAFATSDETQVSTTCYNRAASFVERLPGFLEDLPGLWYRFVGTGGNVQVAATCGNGLGSVNLHIYKSSMSISGDTSTACSPPSSLQCVTGSWPETDTCPQSGTFVNVTTTMGTMYYLLVRKSEYTSNIADPSTFQVSLQSLPAGPPVVSSNVVVPIFKLFQCPAAQEPPVAPPKQPPVAAPVSVSSPKAAAPLSLQPVQGPVSVSPPMGGSVPQPNPPAPAVVVIPSPVVPVTPPMGPMPVIVPVTPPVGPMPVIAPLPVSLPVRPPTPSPVNLPPSPVIAPSPKQAPVAVAPIVAPSSPARPPSSSSSRCRRVGCRVRRVFKAFFGIFN